MSSGEVSHDKVPITTEVLFIHDVESSEDPPMDEWSSLNFEPPDENIKRLCFEQNLYDPGSGEICSKYISLSASSVLRHPYFNYPGVIDPGIEEALLQPEPKVIYPDDGQELYLALCKEMGICPVRSYYRQLLEDKINLRYYGINSMGFRAIALSIKNNRTVTVLDLTDNWINEDGCFHLGEMFIENITLRELNLQGCRIGSEGARRLFANLHLNRAIRKLDLSKNKLGDTGIEYLAKAIFMGSDVRNLNLSYNELTTKALVALNEAFETHNKLTHLNLSWNTILSPNAIYNLCSKLSENNAFEELNFSWNSLSGQRIGKAIKILMSNPNVRVILLDNNKFSAIAIKEISTGLSSAKSLVTLDLSFNPLTPDDAMTLLLTLKERRVKLQNLILDNIFVKEHFLTIKNEILSLKFRKNAVVTWGGVIPKFVSKGADIREIALNRADALCKKSKKRPIDVALVILELYKFNKEPMDVKEFARALKNNGAIFDEGLLEEFFINFAGPPAAKARTIDLASLADYLSRMWPDRKLPPTPPPEPMPMPPKPATDVKK